ncbi:TSUP family transporter [Rubinisphaera margarita]|uniref:TSUP family transporter n=1 Tax=Rubinisphaera margarita TaxID=2909586 RepID=UPI001EE9116C|nr:TSUP family transporter [Rubinisphaera margarita]MCG6155349.1 hypothetical protein [Rubinisphaera margarita]
MYELIFSGDGNLPLLFCLMAAAGLVGLSAGGAPGVGSLAAPMVALGFARLDKPQALVVPLLIVGQMRALVQPQRSHIQTRLAHRALVPTTIGMFGGIAVWGYLIQLPNTLGVQNTLKAACGLIVLAIATDILMSRVLRLYPTPHLGPKASILLGLVGGVLSTVANVAGPLFTWYFQSRGLQKDDLTATVAYFFLVLNLFKIPFYIWLGLFHDPNILQSGADWLLFFALWGFAWMMWLLGAFWRRHASERLFAAPIAAAGILVAFVTFYQTLFNTP